MAGVTLHPRKPIDFPLISEHERPSPAVTSRVRISIDRKIRYILSISP